MNNLDGLSFLGRVKKLLPLIGISIFCLVLSWQLINQKSQLNENKHKQDVILKNALKVSGEHSEKIYYLTNEMEDTIERLKSKLGENDVDVKSIASQRLKLNGLSDELNGQLMNINSEVSNRSKEISLIHINVIEIASAEETSAKKVGGIEMLYFAWATMLIILIFSFFILLTAKREDKDKKEFAYKTIHFVCGTVLGLAGGAKL